jgi:hypothetical protein
VDCSSSSGFILEVIYGFDFYVCCLLICEFCCLTFVFCIFFDRLQRLRGFSAQKGRTCLGVALGEDGSIKMKAISSNEPNFQNVKNEYNSL